MSNQPEHAPDLEFDLADRLRKSLRVSDISVQEMADYLEVSRNTVGRWLSGAGEPKRLYLRMWAMKAGVPLEWLQTGHIKNETPSPDGDGVSSPLPDLNRRPALYEFPVHRLAMAA